MNADTAVVRWEAEPSPVPGRPWQSVRIYADGTREVSGRYGSKSAAMRWVNKANRALHNDGSEA